MHLICEASPGVKHLSFVRLSPTSCLTHGTCLKMREWWLPQGSNPEIYMLAPSWWKKLERTNKRVVIEEKFGEENRRFDSTSRYLIGNMKEKENIFKEKVIFSWLSSRGGLAGAGGSANYLYYPHPSSFSPFIWSCDNKGPNVWGNQPSLAFDTVSCMGQGPIDGDRQSFALRLTDGNISCTLPLCNRHVVELQVCSLPCPNKHQSQPWLKAEERVGNRPSHMFIQPWPPHGPAIVLLSGTEWACRGVRASRMTSPAGGKRGQTGCFYFCPAWYSWSFIPLR